MSASATGNRSRISSRSIWGIERAASNRNLRSSYVAPSVALYFVHARVGCADNFVHRGAVARGRGQADAGADFQFQSGFHAKVGFHQRAMQLLCQARRSLGVGPWHQDDELVAAIAEAKILASAQFL